MTTPSHEWTTHDEKKYFKYLVAKYEGAPMVILRKLLLYKNLMYVKCIRSDWGVVDRYRVLKVLDEYISQYKSVVKSLLTSKE